jgi:hypothetical protein
MCIGIYYTILEVTEFGVASVISTIVQYPPVRMVYSWCARLTTLPLSCADYLKIWDPNLLEPSGPVQGFPYIHYINNGFIRLYFV